MSRYREFMQEDTEAIEKLISQVKQTSLTEDFSVNTDGDEKLLLPGYYRCISTAYLPFISAALTMETALISEARAHWMSQLELVKLIAAILIVRYSLVATYWEDEQLCVDGDYELVDTEADPQLVHRSAQLYHKHAACTGLDKSVANLLVATKLSWWETGEHIQRTPMPCYMRDAIRQCGLDETLEEHQNVVDCVGRWTSTLKMLNTFGIVTRHCLSLWHASEPFVLSGLVQLCPAGNAELTFCVCVFRAAKNSPTWRMWDLDGVIMQTIRMYDHICSAWSAVYHESASYLTGETDQVRVPLPKKALEKAVKIVKYCVPERQCSSVRRLRWFQTMARLVVLTETQTPSALHIDDETAIVLEHLAELIEAKEYLSERFQPMKM
ncbi:hypothetical protein FBUS_10805 [Fasciolopsis buskii]|uniref:Uncharacterized protein n=1 Tax=Fasciolopsis buskii TaxID=27845 RepID=A0A8E0VNE1_9TREM|nr:hypothetical protein FBUS_10805 [Fasciolopsis buski]